MGLITTITGLIDKSVGNNMDNKEEDGRHFQKMNPTRVITRQSVTTKLLPTLKL